MNVFAPIAASSSTAIAVEGEPIPVEQTETIRPLSSPVYVVYSRFRAISRGRSSSFAIGSTRPGSPGSKTTSPTSPGLQRMWYCTSPMAEREFRLLAPGVAGGRERIAHEESKQRRRHRLVVGDRHVNRCILRPVQ